jgi:tellurium resistance protein TerZ
MGLGWDAVESKGFFGFGGGQKNVDLDASAMLFDNQGNLVDQVWFQQLKSKCGALVHTGDNLSGAGDGDDEQIKVDLTLVPANIQSMFFVVNSFTGQSFNDIENAFCRVVDDTNGEEFARYDLSAQGAHTAQIMIKIYRHNNAWKAYAIGENCSGRTFQDLLPAVKPHL